MNILGIDIGGSGIPEFDQPLVEVPNNQRSNPAASSGNAVTKEG